jgi:hypothetical protein
MRGQALLHVTYQNTHRFCRTWNEIPGNTVLSPDTPLITGRLPPASREFPLLINGLGCLLSTSLIGIVESKNAFRGNNLIGQQQSAHQSNAHD